MVFQASRKVLMLPMVLGVLNLVFGGALLVTRAAAGGLKLDFDTAGAVILVVMGFFFTQIAWKLSRYRLETTDAALVVGPGKPDDPARALPLSEIDQLVREETPAKGRRKATTIYKVRAGKRHLAFTSLLFEHHAELAALVAERSGRDWETEVKA